MTNNQIQLKDKNNNKCYPNPYWPVGSIFLSMNNTNPAVYFGGTWQLIGQGRTLVGVNTSDSALNTSNKTGGSTNPLTFHNHTQNPHGHNIVLSGEIQPGGERVRVDNWSWSTSFQYHSTTIQESTAVNKAAGDNTNHNNWQPFLTCYIWNRIS